MQRCNALAEQKEVLLSFVTQKAQTPGQVRNSIIREHIICDQVGFLNCGLIKMQALWYLTTLLLSSDCCNPDVSDL